MGMKRSFKPTNLITNGNFANGTMGWSILVADGQPAPVANNDMITYTALKQYGGYKNLVNFITNHYYYYRAIVSGANTVQIGISDNINFTDIKAHSSSSGFELMSKIYKPTAVGGTSDQRIFFIRDSAPSGWGAISFYGCMVLDLTATFAAGLEPNVAWCDLNIPNWFDGTLSGGVMNGKGGLK